MGKTAAVISEVKNSGKSVFTFILANQIREMVTQDTKILVCCLNSKFSLLYKLLGINEVSPGIEELINLQESGCENKARTLADLIPRSNGIYFLGSYKTTNSYVNRNVEGFSTLVDSLGKTFDLIIFDTVSSKENTLTDIVLDKSSMLINLFVQDAESVNKLKLVGDKMIHKCNEIYLITKYRDIYPRVSDIKRRFSLDKLFKMDYCETLQEMKNRDSLHLYLQRDTECNHSVRVISKYITQIFDLDIKSNNKDGKKVNYLKSIFDILT
ncbi:hypothetical protein [Ruminiclostridium papyrosolvens]|uniref:AAA domain-containing protein n=1 Tax=Ruminiclostridium papyrosolvens C7 TaxID=1330534 RepID=U4R797_9FIRM|nr:hypothetical protein [Ruminiclostridium papyrosolvens]EPR14348.1 hypothetical protein L323_00670 [Ruminiclostridium papyrosolvens C7]